MNIIAEESMSTKEAMIPSSDEGKYNANINFVSARKLVLLYYNICQLAVLFQNMIV